MDQSSAFWRIFRLAAIPLIAVVLVLVLIAAVRTGAQPPATSAERVVLPPVIPPATVVPAATPLPDPSPTVMALQPDPAIIAIVNDKIITQIDMDQAAAVDRAMSALAGRDPTPVRAVLEQLINGEVVWQAVKTARVALVDGQTPLVALLATLGRTDHDLDVALDTEKLPRAEFDAYFARLTTIDQFARSEAKRFGNSSDAYVRELQRAAHISFGPSAGELLAVTLPTEPQLVPGVAVTVPIAAVNRTTDTAVNLAGVVTDAAPTPTPAAAVVRGTEPGQLAPAFQLAALNSLTDTLRLDDFLVLQRKVAHQWGGWPKKESMVLFSNHYQ